MAVLNCRVDRFATFQLLRVDQGQPLPLLSRATTTPCFDELTTTLCSYSLLTILLRTRADRFLLAKPGLPWNSRAAPYRSMRLKKVPPQRVSQDGIA